MKTLRTAIAFIALIVLWQVACTAFSIPSYVLPKPIEVAREMGKDPVGLLQHFSLTLLESLTGLIVAWLFAIGTAFLVFMVPKLEESLLPLIVGFKAIPLVALAPLVILWFGNGFISKSVMAATICFFPLVVGYLKGFRSCTDDEVLFLRNLELSRSEELFRFRLMKATPFWLAGLRVASVLAVVGAIVAEFSGANAGLGYIVIVSAVRIDTPLLMTGILLSALCGIALYLIAIVIESLMLKRMHMEPLPE
jgi:NitT/TauT family transport system permease protein